MKNISVTTFIHTIFILALVVISLTFFILLNATEDQRNLQQIYKYKFIANTYILTKNLKPKDIELKKLYKKYSLKSIPIEESKKVIEDKGETVFSGSSIYGEVRVFKVDNRYLIYANRYNFEQMLEDMHPIDYTTQYIFTVALFLVVLLLVLYLMLLKKIAPLKRLHKQIERFATGDLDINIDYRGDDEIARIAKSFDKAIKYIKQLISSKNLFMRNIMHELKTPITTSRIAADTVEDESVKRLLVRSFDRMNGLIEELAEIERVTMYTFTPKKGIYLFSEIFKEAESMLLKSSELYSFEYKDNEVFTDKDMLALVLKNLIDNAIKYGEDSRANIVVVGNKILVKSKGERLKESLSFYTEPFSQDEKRSAGFGLGLYIVYTVLDKLDYDFRYRYIEEERENIFEILMY